MARSRTESVQPKNLTAAEIVPIYGELEEGAGARRLREHVEDAATEQMSSRAPDPRLDAPLRLAKGLDQRFIEPFAQSSIIRPWLSPLHFLPSRR